MEDLRKKILQMKPGTKFKLTEKWCKENGLKNCHVRSWGREIAKDPAAFGLCEDYDGNRIVENIGSDRARYYVRI